MRRILGVLGKFRESWVGIQKPEGVDMSLAKRRNESDKDYADRVHVAFMDDIGHPLEKSFREFQVEHGVHLVYVVAVNVQPKDGGEGVNILRYTMGNEGKVAAWFSTVSKMFTGYAAQLETNNILNNLSKTGAPNGSHKTKGRETKSRKKRSDSNRQGSKGPR